MTNNLINSKLSPFRLIFVLLLIAVCFAACSEDVELYADSNPLPIVYSLLDPASETQYVRIGKSYQPNDNTATNPPASDSTVWDITHEVYIEEYTDGIKGKTFRYKPDTTIKKDTGFFPVTNLRVYSSAFKPVSGNTYQLYVYFPDLDLMASAKTIVHGSPDIVDPLPLSIRKITFDTGTSYKIRCYPGQNTGIYQMTFRIHYLDSTTAGLEVNSADYTSEAIFEQRSNQILTFTMGGGGFYEAMSNEIPIKQGVVRSVVSVEFIIITGGNDLGFLYRTSIGQGGNFNNLSEYTNIGNGIGIFSSRIVTRIPNLTLSNVTLDLLAHSEITRSLGFTDSKGE